MNKSLFFPIIVLLMANMALNAQNPIKGSATDEKYGYTTIVYKDSTATDMDVLNRLNDMGMGDVIRITEAPPKPAPAPKVKTVSATPVKRNISGAVPTPRAVLASDNDPVASVVTTPAPVVALPGTEDTTVAVETAAPQATNNAIAPMTDVPTTALNTEKSQSTTYTTHSNKAYKYKVSKKTSKKFKAPKRSKKKGKQRYHCYKF
jgi:hypothetical protein